MARDPKPPRLVPLAVAASYCSLPPKTFERLAKEGVMPTSLRLGQRRLWDRHAIDEALDRLKSTSLAPLSAATVSSNATTEEIALMRLRGLDHAARE